MFDEVRTARTSGGLPEPGQYEPHQAPIPARPFHPVLLIEDSRVDRMLLRAAITLRGGDRVRLTEAADLDVGLSLLEQRRFDLVLLDEELPEVQPGDAVRAVRDAAPATPIIHHAGYLEATGWDTSQEHRLDALVDAVHAALLPGGMPG